MCVKTGQGSQNILMDDRKFVGLLQQIIDSVKLYHSFSAIEEIS